MYKLTQMQAVIRKADAAYIPFDTSNTDYAEYLAWLSGGGVPDPADIAPTPSLQERIDALVRQQSQGQIQNELMLEGLMAGLLGGHLATGGTEPDLVTRNSAYRMGKQLRVAIATLRAQA